MFAPPMETPFVSTSKRTMPGASSSVYVSSTENGGPSSSRVSVSVRTGDAAARPHEGTASANTPVRMAVENFSFMFKTPFRGRYLKMMIVPTHLVVISGPASDSSSVKRRVSSAVSPDVARDSVVRSNAPTPTVSEEAGVNGRASV